MAQQVVSDEDDIKSEINVVPLIDVMLVLLVIFMITAPMLQQGVEVNLPKATTAPLPGKGSQVFLAVNKEKKMFLGEGKNEVILDDVGTKVAAVLSQRGPDDQKIFIHADKGLEYGFIMEVMGKLHEAGITQIGLVSSPTDK